MNRHIVYRFDDFQVDPDTFRLTRHGREVHLEPVVLRLLLYLIEERDRLITRDELMDAVWGDTVISEAALSKAVARLRKALDDHPATPRYLETVHSRGYRFVAEVEEAEDEGRGPRPALESRSWSWRRNLFIAVLVVILSAVLVRFWPQGPESALKEPGAIRSLAVLPLNNMTGDADLAYVVDGIQDTLITELSRLRELRVISRQSTIRYRGSDLPLPQIARELGVDALVEGSVLRMSDRVELNLQLVSGHNDSHLWAQRYERDPAFVFDLFTEAAGSIGTALELQSPGDLVGPVDPQATRAYWRGLDQLDRLTPSSIEIAIEQFRTAVRIEPGFSLAWGNLAAAHAMYAMRGQGPARESIEQAKAAAHQAIEAGGHSNIGYSALGWVRIWSLDLTGACEAFRQALRINPSEPYALHGEADCLMHRQQMDESVQRTRELALVAPLTFVQNVPLAYHLAMARRFDEALEATVDISERFPQSPVHTLLSLIYWARGEYEMAIEEERQWLAVQSDTVLLEALDQGMRAGGPRRAMRSVAEALVARSTESFVDPYRIGEAFARAGATDEAILWLRKAVTEGSFEVSHIAFRPDFDGLRQDPRFSDLLKRVSLQPGEAP